MKKKTAEPPRLVGVVHLPPLPGSPRFSGSLAEVCAAATADARALAGAGFDAIILENFGDAPFAAGPVAPVTISAMTRCALAVASACPDTALGINVLRNDARAALAVAGACDAAFIRINIHVGARVTDQGIIEGRAHDTLRERHALGFAQVALWCDVAVKHSAPLAPRPIAEEAREALERGLADAILVTGSGTGEAADDGDIDAILAAVRAPLYVASGAREAALDALMRPRAHGRVHGVIVGSALRASGRAGDPVDPARAARFADAFRRAR